MELGETLEETARRETFEEVGLTVNNLKLMNVFSGQELYYKYPSGDEVFNVTAAYICDDFSGKLTVDKHESKDARFFLVSELPAEVCPPDRAVLKEFISLTQNATMKPSA
jgi:NADH pyrophosphatase NudC (nudix superfamily)